MQVIRLNANLINIREDVRTFVPYLEFFFKVVLCAFKMMENEKLNNLINQTGFPSGENRLS